MTRLIERVPAAVPGLILYGVLWVIVLVQIDYSSATSGSIDTLWQSLGLEYLSADPLGNLSVLHIQPWGVNALYSFDLALTPTSHVVLLMVYMLAGAATIILLAATLLRLGMPRVCAMVDRKSVV